MERELSEVAQEIDMVATMEEGLCRTNINFSVVFLGTEYKHQNTFQIIPDLNVRL